MWTYGLNAKCNYAFSSFFLFWGPCSFWFKKKRSQLCICTTWHGTRFPVMKDQLKTIKLRAAVFVLVIQQKNHDIDPVQQTTGLNNKMKELECYCAQSNWGCCTHTYQWVRWPMESWCCDLNLLLHSVQLHPQPYSESRLCGSTRGRE